MLQHKKSAHDDLRNETTQSNLRGTTTEAEEPSEEDDGAHNGLWKLYLEYE